VENSVLEDYFSRLQMAAKARGVPLSRIAAETKIALSTMYRWKDSAPQARTSQQIADYLRVSESWLREGFGEMEMRASTTQEEVTPYKFTLRTTPSHPLQSSDLHAGCVAMFNAMPHATTTQAFDFAVLTFEQHWQKYKEAKYSELNQLPP
jgi:hypothetical protein